MVELSDIKYGELEELILKVKENMDWYSSKPYDRNRYTLYLSNGKMLNIKFPKNVIAHLLGINTEYLKSTRLFSEKNSYDILNRACYDFYNVYQKIRDGYLNPRSFISEYIDDKLLIFRENVGINFSKIEFVCEYNKDRSYTTGYMAKDVDYFIGSKIDNDHLMILGLKQNGDTYYPITSQYIDKTSEKGSQILNECLTSQVLLSPESLLIYNDINGFKCKKYDAEGDKIERLNVISMYASLYNCSLDYSASSIYSLKKLEGIRKSYDIVTKIICDCMMVGKKVDWNEHNIDMNNIPLALRQLVDLYNTLDFSKDSNADLIKDLLEYKSESQQIIQKLKDECQEYKSMIVSLEQDKKSLTVQVSSLQNEVSGYQETIGNIRKLVM